MTSSLKTLLVCAALVAVATCDKPPTTPPPPPPVTLPTIACPADLSVEVDRATSAVVQYPTPAASGGVAPLTTACTIPQGGTAPTGTTEVICTTTDSLAQRAQCVFHITVSEIPRLKGTSFLAFGDSITCCEIGAPQITPQFQDEASSYQKVLEGMLRARYKAQNIAFSTDHVGAERIVQSEQRLMDALDATRPEILLFFEGANDVVEETPLSDVSNSLRSNIQRAKQQGVKVVFLSTVLPEIAGLSHAKNPEGVAPMNNMIRQTAVNEGAVLVDSFAAVEPRKDVLIGDDGLHPTVEGSRVIAETFLAAIKANFEEPPTPATPSLLRNRFNLIPSAKR